MSEYKKPVPTIRPWTKGFWEAAKKHELVIQQCKDCGEKQWYPKNECANCRSKNLGWSKVSGKGKIFSYSIIHEGAPFEFRDVTPYVIALVELDEGIIYGGTNIVGYKDLKDVKIGAPVEVTFDDVTKEISLPKFKLIYKR
ncbi:MAG: Zn-ribbon domain-containing OB-fold protein [Candidatus Jordarchaeum sp.]|uniref:Zn-ribbon domain-containing OB-fold protein n=1 Tax=Candidatus Jordarchaeum sp. TaxID=2823881 RepID=UPI00404A55A9